jgi:hypothetical protein
MLFLKLFGHGLLLFLTVLLQVSFISALPDIFWGLNLIYVVILVQLFFHRIYLFIVWIILGGFLWDYFSSFPFGVMLFILLLSVSLIYILLTTLLTNRSYYAFLIYIIFGTIVYTTVLHTFGFFLNVLFDMQLVLGWGLYFKQTFFQILILEAAAIIGYWAYQLVLRRIILAIRLSLR